MREFSQATLDAHLAEISANLTPEQAEQFQRTAKQRIADSGTVYTDGSVDGAFELIGFLAQSGSKAASLPDKIGAALSVIDPRKLDIGSIPGSDIAGQAGDAISGAVSGIGRMLGNVGGLKDVASGAVGKAGEVASGAKSLGGEAVARVGDMVGGADGVRQTGISAAGDVVGFGGNVASGIGGALGGLQNAIGSGGGSAVDAIGGALGSASGALDVAGSAADLAGIVLGALGDVLGSLTDL